MTCCELRVTKSAAAKEAAAEAEVVDEDALLEEFRLLNEKFAAGNVSEDDFEYRKAEIFAELGLGEPPEPREPADEASSDADA